MVFAGAMRTPSTLPWLSLLALVAGASNASSASAPLAQASSQAAQVPEPNRRHAQARALQAALAPHADDITRCVAQVSATYPVPEEPAASVVFRFSPDARRFLGPEQTARTTGEARPKTARPFEAALETCLHPRVGVWTLPPPKVDDASFVAFQVVVRRASPPDSADWDDCFVDAEAASLRGVLSNADGRRVELGVMQVANPKKIAGRDPRFTTKARQEGSQGVQRMRCTVTVVGWLKDCETLQSVPHMDDAVLEALGTWRLRPHTCNGRPTAARYTLNLLLQLMP